MSYLKMGVTACIKKCGGDAVCAVGVCLPVADMQIEGG